MIELFFYWLSYRSDVFLVSFGLLYIIHAGLLVVQMQTNETRRHWRRVYLDAKAYNEEYARRVERDGYLATMLVPPELGEPDVPDLASGKWIKDRKIGGVEGL